MAKFCFSFKQCGDLAYPRSEICASPALAVHLIVIYISISIFLFFLSPRKLYDSCIFSHHVLLYGVETFLPLVNFSALLRSWTMVAPCSLTKSMVSFRENLSRFFFLFYKKARCSAKSGEEQKNSRTLFLVLIICRAWKYGLRACWLKRIVEQWARISGSQRLYASKELCILNAACSVGQPLVGWTGTYFIPSFWYLKHGPDYNRHKKLEKPPLPTLK